MSGVDFHSHILPGVDDGSESIDESLAMLRMMAKQGIDHVVATPHFYANHDTPDAFLARRAEAEEKLRKAMAQCEGLPRLTVGAEVHFFSGISESDCLNLLTIGANRCILIEMSHVPWSESMYRELSDIRTMRGITPIIAHVDRYISPFRTYHIPERLAQLPVLVQANAEFFLHRSTARWALRLLREDKIQLLGSDSHNLTSRPPNLGDALQVINTRLGMDAIEQIQFYQRQVLQCD